MKFAGLAKKLKYDTIEEFNSVHNFITQTGKTDNFYHTSTFLHHFIALSF